MSYPKHTAKIRNPKFPLGLILQHLLMADYYLILQVDPELQWNCHWSKVLFNLSKGGRIQTIRFQTHPNH